MKKGEKVGKAQFKTADRKQKPFMEVVEEYTEICKRKSLSKYTIQGYRYVGGYFNNFNESNLISANSIIDYIDYLQSKETKWTTINSYVRKLTPIFNYANDMGYYPKVKVIDVKGQKEIKEVYNDDELMLLLEKPKTKDFRNIRNWVMTWVFISTGIRRSELLNLKVGNVNLIERTLLLSKTKNKKARYVPVSSSLFEVLDEYLQIRNGENDDYLFPTVYNTQMSTSTINKELELYNLSRNVLKTGIHKYRHTFITTAVNENVNILLLKKITGHESTNVLNGYYNSKVKDTLEIIDSIAPKSKNKKNKFKK